MDEVLKSSSASQQLGRSCSLPRGRSENIFSKVVKAGFDFNVRVLDECMNVSTLQGLEIIIIAEFLISII